MIYAFLSDEAFAATEAAASVMPVDSIQKYGLGVLDDNLLNYFSKHTIISDPVGSPKAGTVRRTRLQRLDNYMPTVDVAYKCPTGRAYLNYDSAKIVDSATSEYQFIKALTINVDVDDDDTMREKTQKRAALFNIIETIFFSRTQVSTVESLSSIEATLMSSQALTYSGYVSGSLRLSSTLTTGEYRYESTDVNHPTASSSDLSFYDYCSFKFNYGPDETDVIELMIWLSVAQFKANYPYSTITDVVYPCKPEWILDPRSYGSEVRAVLLSSDYKDNVLDTAVTERDHSGIVVYKTKYAHSSVSYDAKMGFVVMYKGAVPSAESVRNAIRNKLLDERDSAGRLLATEEEWKAVLPDLFVDQSFYIFPCYYQRVEYGTVIEQNISNYKKLFTKVREFFTDDEYTDIELFQNMEIIQAPGHGMYMVVFPMDLKTGGSPAITSLLKIHPTYQPLDSVGTTVEYIKTTDTIFINKQYYYRNGSNQYEFIPLVVGEDYVIGENIAEKFPDTKIFEKQYIVNRDDWNTMTQATKEFAWSLAHCVAACIDPTINPVEAGFTVEELGVGTKREFYSFVSNATGYHVMTLFGAQGIFDGEE